MPTSDSSVMTLASHLPCAPHIGDACVTTAPLRALPTAARPREKLLARGPAALADAELLAVLLSTGVPGQPVLQMAQQLLTRFGGIAGVLGADSRALASVKGLGTAKRALLAAVRELARRSLRESLAEGTVFDSLDSVNTFLRLHLDGRATECFAVLFLDAGHRLIALEPMSEGTRSHTIVYPREVVKRALALEASAVILAHNHPSGLTRPSEADLALTRTLTAALALVDVKVLDHYIVGAGRAASLSEMGLL